MEPSPSPSLDRLFRPRSVAVVGASAQEESISGRPLKLLRRYGFSGALYPVNPRHQTLGGLPCYPDLLSLPEAPDVVLVGVRADLVPGVIEQCGRVGAGHAVVFSSGFAEGGDPEAQRRLADLARASGVRVLGPNCQGLANLAEGIPLSFSASLDTDRRPVGSVGYISQSGAFGFASFAMAADQGVGFRYVATTGNQADLDVVDLGHYMLSDPEVRLLLLYLEGLSEGERFLHLLETARAKGVPVGVLKVGRSAVAAAAAASHTAALTGDDAVWRALFRQYGVIPLEDGDDIQDLGRLAGSVPPPKGNRVGILTTSGGAGIILADACADAGLEVPSLSPDLRGRLDPYLPSFGSSANPVDMTAQVINDPLGFRGCLRALEESPEVDQSVAVLSMITGESGERMAEDLSSAFGEAKKPLACCWLIDREHGGRFVDRLRADGVPVYSSLGRCARALGALWRWSRSTPEPPVDAEVSRNLLDAFPASLTEHDAKRFLARHGIPVTRERLVTSREEALEAARQIGYPVALKVMSPQIPHKTEAGAVALGLGGDEALTNAYGRILESALRFAPEGVIQGVLVQEMVREGFECLVGVKRDPLFGPLVAVGLGGIYVEVLRDVSLRRAPFGLQTAREMLRELKGYPLLTGARGQKPRDVDALAELVSRVSRIAAAEPCLGELDLNPVFVGFQGGGAVAADALVLRR